MVIQILAFLVLAFLIILVPFYIKNYGFGNFLWLSDIGLFITFFELWFKSPLLNSMAIIGILPLELIWIIDYIFRLIFRHRLIGISDYMFNSELSLFIRGLSLFHIALPIIWFYLLYLWGYDARAFWYQTILVWVVLASTYFFTDPKENVNWVFLPKTLQWNFIPPFLWLIFLYIIFPLFLILPMHLILQAIS